MGTCFSRSDLRRLYNGFLGFLWEAYCTLLFSVLSLPPLYSALGEMTAGKNGSTAFCLVHVAFIFYLVTEFRIQVEYNLQVWRIPGKRSFGPSRGCSLITGGDNAPRFVESRELQVDPRPILKMLPSKASDFFCRSVTLLCLIEGLCLLQVYFFFVAMRDPDKKYFEPGGIHKHDTIPMTWAVVIDVFGFFVFATQVLNTKKAWTLLC